VDCTAVAVNAVQYISRKMLMKDLGLKMYDVLKLIKYNTTTETKLRYIANARF